MQLLHRALRSWRRVTVISRITHTDAVTALIPQGAQTKHTLFTTGAIAFSRPALAQLLNEAFAHVTSTERFVTTQ